MIELYYNERDPRYIFLNHDGAKTKVRKFNHHTRKYEERETMEILALEEHLNLIPSYMRLPSFAGIPKPVCFLEKQRIGERIVYYCLTGLWYEIKTWCREHNIVCNGIYNLNDFDNPNKQVSKLQLTSFDESLEDFKQYVQGWGLNLDLRDYQYKAIWKILHYKQSMSQLATRAGKTLIAYVIFRYMLERGLVHNVLMVVPSISLVKQGVNDMNEYQEFFTSEAVWANGEYCEGANLTIGTFQSLVRRCTHGKRGAINKHYNPKFFDKFDLVCIDECHKADCESIKQIMSQPFIKNAKLIFGFSGTLPDPNTIESYGCQALLGPCIQDISTMELVNAGYLAKPIVHQVRIKYPNNLTDQYIRYGEYLCSNYVTKDGKKVLLPKEERDMTMIHEKKPPVAIRDMQENVDLGLLSKESYMENLIDMCKAQGANLLVLEQMIAEHSTKKLEVMRDICFEWSNSNGIVFAHNEVYIDYLEQYFKNAFPNRPVYKIKGATAQKKRDAIISAMNTIDKDAILVASYGVVGTGLTFKNIEYAIFGQSFKSQIINFQSLGRGLLKTEGKENFHIYDLIDVLPTGSLQKQGEEKVKRYKQRNFEYHITHK